MADMDLEDLDGPSKAPTRPSRFAPKGSKFKPKTESGVSSASVLPPSKESDSVRLTKKEELDSKQPLPSANGNAKTESEVSDPNDVVAMEIDAKAEEEDAEALHKDQLKESVEGDEDEVVREIEVYFTPSIDPNTKLYVLQYPLRPLWRPYELDDRCEEVRVKTGSYEVEVDLAVDVDSKNYDPDADSRVQMKNQTLTSSWKSPIATSHAVGVLVGNKLHLSPIHAVVQLRPSMRHYKPEGSKRKSGANSNLEDTVKMEELNEEKPTGSLKKQSKLPGTLYEQNKDIRESWIPLKYHGVRSDVSARYLKKMVEQDHSPLQFSMSRSDYVNTLCPGTSNENNRSKGLSRRLLLSLPLEERFRTWLLEGPPIHRFDALKHLAPDASVEEILEALRRHARLVQGLWVPKSPLLYGTDVGLEVLARDYILLLFSKSPIINNSQLPTKPNLVKAMRDVLNILAFERASLGDWKFKEPPDVTFIKLNPNIVKEQQEAWERLEKHIPDNVFGGRHRNVIKNSSKSITTNNPAALKSSSKQASKSSNGGLSRIPMSEETREALPKALEKLFKDHKVCSFQQICQRLREMAIAESARPKGFAKEAVAAARGVDAPPEELQAVISQVAINIHGVYISKSSPDNPQFDQFRKVVIDLFIAEGPNAKIKKASMVEAARLQLKRDITPQEYQKVLQELCISQNSAWVLKSGDGNPR